MTSRTEARGSEKAASLAEDQAVPTTPQQLPPSTAETSETVAQKDREILPSSRLESELKGVRHNIATVDEELGRFDTRLSGTTTPDERWTLKEKRKVFEQRRKVLVDREAFLLRKIDSFTRAAEVQRHEEAKRSLA
jgi:hypothetical protein